MNRRSAAASLAALIVAGCGGGGGGGGDGTGAGAGLAAPAPANTTPAPAAFAGSSGIALWGDSMIPGIASAFGYLWEPPRQVFDGGISGQTSPEIAARATADTGHRDWVTIFWMGHNNDTDPGRIKADIAASVAHLAPGNNRFIVLSVLNKADGSEDRGSPRYNTVMQLNADLAATYGDNFLDIRSFMVAQSDRGNPAQAQEIDKDLPSSSLRFDGIHLTGSGDEVVGRRLIEFIRAKGW
jgi:lysophospholipase L1-like esterase